jgi:hypothetical protein
MTEVGWCAYLENETLQADACIRAVNAWDDAQLEAYRHWGLDIMRRMLLQPRWRVRAGA